MLKLFEKKDDIISINRAALVTLIKEIRSSKMENLNKILFVIMMLLVLFTTIYIVSFVRCNVIAGVGRPAIIRVVNIPKQ